FHHNLIINLQSCWRTEIMLNSSCLKLSEWNLIIKRRSH
ncbi:uncharacterized protein METZ01_LOCUS484627, partial [marine metagenome]